MDGRGFILARKVNGARHAISDATNQNRCINVPADERRRTIESLITLFRDGREPRTFHLHKETFGEG